MTDDPTIFTDERVDTGFVTATVTELEIAAPEPLTPEGIQALKALAPPIEKTSAELMSIARDIAMDIQILPKILAKHGITNVQYDYLSQHNEFFKQAVTVLCREWQSIGSTKERIRVQAAAALEEQLPIIASRVGSKTEKLEAVVEGAKLLAKIADVDSPSGGGVGSGERFSINIDLGGSDGIKVSLHSPGVPESPQADQQRGVLPIPGRDRLP